MNLTAIEKAGEIFQDQYSKALKTKTFAALDAAVKGGKATVQQAERYAQLLGSTCSKAIVETVTAAGLLDEKVYFSTAMQILKGVFGENEKLVKEACEVAQTNFLGKIGKNIKPQIADFDPEQLRNIANGIDKAEKFKYIADTLDSKCVWVSSGGVDRSTQKLGQLLNNAGVNCTIVRTAQKGCCAWCTMMGGEYTYPNVPDDVYKKHGGCRCIVDIAANRKAAIMMRGRSR